MELRQVRYFVAVAEEGNFGRAAEKLRIAQSGISQQIKALERSLGAELVDRSSRPIQLTPEGEVFLEEARLMLELADRAKEQVQVVARQRRIHREGRGERVRPPSGGRRAPRRGTQAAHGHRPADPSRHQQSQRRVTASTGIGRDLLVRAVRVGRDASSTSAWARSSSASPCRKVIDSRRSIGYRRASSGTNRSSWVPAARTPRWPTMSTKPCSGGWSPRVPCTSTTSVAGSRLVAEGLGVSAVAIPTETSVPRPGVVYRRFDEPEPKIEFGLLWFEDHLSPPLEAFLRLAREIAREAPSTPDDLVVEEDLAVEEA